LHDLVEVRGRSEGSRETEGSEGTGKLDESVVEFDSTGEMRRSRNRVT